MNVTVFTTLRNAGARLARFCLPAAVLLAANVVITPAAHAQTWTNGGGNGLWSNLSNWTATPGVYRYFDNTGVGASTANAYSNNFWGLFVTNSTGTHAININSGTLAFGTYSQIEIGNSATGAMQLSNGTFLAPQLNSQPLRLGRANTAAAAGTLIGTSSLTTTLGFTGLSTVGYADSTFNAAANLNMADSDNGSLTFASLRAAFTQSTGIATSNMSFGDNWTFNIGSSGARGEMVFGSASSTGTANSSFTTGTGGSFTAYTSSLYVGTGANTTSKTSIVDMSGINNGLIDHSGGNSSFSVGRGAGSGSLKLGSDWTMNVNTDHAVFIGYDGGTGSITGTNMTLSGSIPYLYVGTLDSGAVGGNGTLDMGGGSMGSGLVVSAYLRIGNGGNSTGTVKFGSGLVAVNGTTDIGDGGTTGVEGLLELRGTQFTGGAAAIVNVQNSGRLNILVSDTSSGLILTRANSAALTIADTLSNGNGILATFQNNPTGFNFLGTAESHDSIYWAIKWSGDQQSSLNSFISANKIGANTSGLTGDLAGATPEVIYDAGSNSTYYGIYVSAVPEPGTLALASCGMALAGWSVARRRRAAQAA
jgi:hypothetical protein